MPVDLLWGASDKLLSVDYAKRLAAQLPAARLTTIERCGHAPPVECPDRFTEALLKVLKDPLPAPTVSSPPVAAPTVGDEAVISGDVLGERARLSPEKTALVEVATGRRFTYAELDARAKAAARTLTEGLGLKKGDRLALLAGNRVEFLDVFFACGKTGVVLVPLNTRQTAGELEGVVSDAEPKALIYGAAFEETAEDLLRRVRGVRGLRRSTRRPRPCAAPAPPSKKSSLLFLLLSSSGAYRRRCRNPRSRRSLLPPLHLRHDGQAEGRHGAAPDGRVERGQHGRLLAAARGRRLARSTRRSTTPAGSARS